MDRPGSKRIVGVALLISGLVLLVLSVLFWTGVFPVQPEARPVLGVALLLAALVDAGIGVKFLQSAGD
jgi:drug/metabolite transporter (DMT)-like permease